MIELLEKKIDDWKFLRVIKKMLKAGYMEDWKYHRTQSGTPQGGIISPILANIYLHELDCYVETLKHDFNKGDGRQPNWEYRTIVNRVGKLNQKIKGEQNPEIRDHLIALKQQEQRRSLELPSTDQYDPDYRRLHYCRYADDFMLGVIGPKSEAMEVMEKIKAFLHERLHLKYSEAKTGLKHNSEIIRFLGYDITVINSEKTVKGIYHGQHTKRRTGKGHITLYVPDERLQKFATYRKYGNWETLEPDHKAFLRHLKDYEIIQIYSTEMRGLANYYALANNYAKALWKLHFLAKGSFLKTMAGKYKTSVHKMARILNRGEYLAVRVPQKDKEPREYKLFSPKDIDRSKERGLNVDNLPLIMQYMGRSELQERREARVCEYCGREGGYFEIHHVRKLADLKDGKNDSERMMIARRRKTQVMCVGCHHLRHAGKLPDRRHLQKE
jgi:hypothetical protein